MKLRKLAEGKFFFLDNIHFSVTYTENNTRVMAQRNGHVRVRNNVGDVDTTLLEMGLEIDREEEAQRNFVSPDRIDRRIW